MSDWFHSFTFPDGEIIQGCVPEDILEKYWIHFSSIDFKGKTVLDIGCWDGFHSARAALAGAKSVTSIDVNPWMREDWKHHYEYVMKKFGITNAQCRYQDLYTLDSNEKYDIVIFMGVLYHLQNPMLALQKMREVTSDLLILETLVDCEELSYPAMKFYPGKEMANDPTNWFGPNRLWIESALPVHGFNNNKLVTMYSNRALYYAR